VAGGGHWSLTRGLREGYSRPLLLGGEPLSLQPSPGAGTSHSGHELRHIRDRKAYSGVLVPHRQRDGGQARACLALLLLPGRRGGYLLRHQGPVTCAGSRALTSVRGEEHGENVAHGEGWPDVTEMG
jgi:hypothetical protein